MPMSKSQLLEYLQDAFPNSIIDINALQHDDDHWAIHIQAHEFKGKSRVQQHQMVYDALQGHMGTTLHALALQTSPLE